MKTEREIEIEEIYGKSIFDMSTKEILENNLSSDYVNIVDENVESGGDQMRAVVYNCENGNDIHFECYMSNAEMESANNFIDANC